MKNLYQNLKLITLVIVATLGFSSIEAAPPNLLYPANNDECISLNVEFEWSLVTAATSYEIQVARDINFTDLVVDEDDIGERRYEATLPDFNQEYFWRVKSFIIGQTEDWSEPFSFTSTHTPPVLVAPADETECLDLTQTFSWNTINNGTNYRLQISTNPNFTNIILDTTRNGLTSVATTLPSYFTSYYWRVRGDVAGCVGDWSEFNQLKTVVGPPTKTFPGDSAKGLDFQITFSWDSEPGATAYMFELSEDPTFATTIVSDPLVPSNTFTHTLAEYNKRYFWRVRSIGISCNSIWSEPFTFKTFYEKTELVDPADETECLPLVSNFTWQAVNGATTYRFQLAGDPSFQDNVLLQDVEMVEALNYLATINENNRMIWWRVRAEDNENFGIWSDSYMFETTIFSPTLLTPDEDTEEVPRGALLTWRYNTAVKNFHLQVSRDMGFTDIIFEDDTDITLPQQEVLLPDYNTVYYWRVRATNDDCWSDWSETFSFKSIKGFPDLMLPENNATNLQLGIQFEWEQVQYALSYDLRVSKSSNFDALENQSINGVDFNSILRDGFDANTTYYWRVRSNDQWGTSPWSETFSFRTGLPDAKIPKLLIPINNSVLIDSDGTLEWSQAEGATSYHLLVALDRDFNDIVIDEETVSGTTYDYSGLEPYTEYYWKVAAQNQTSKTDFATRFKFRTAAIPPTAAPNIVTPTNQENDVKYQPSLMLEWSEIIEAKINKFGESGYEVKINTNNNLDGDVLIHLEKVYEESTTIPNLSPETGYFWAVRAWNESGIGPWSDIVSFTTARDINSVPFGEYKNINAVISPNPAKNQASLSFNLENPSKLNISIIDLMGNTLFELNNAEYSSGYNSLELNLNGFLPGLYIFIIQHSDYYQTGKLIINN